MTMFARASIAVPAAPEHDLLAGRQFDHVELEPIARAGLNHHRPHRGRRLHSRTERIPGGDYQAKSRATGKRRAPALDPENEITIIRDNPAAFRPLHGRAGMRAHHQHRGGRGGRAPGEARPPSAAGPARPTGVCGLPGRCRSLPPRWSRPKAYPTPARGRGHAGGHATPAFRIHHIPYAFRHFHQPGLRRCCLSRSVPNGRPAPEDKAEAEQVVRTGSRDDTTDCGQ